MTTTTETVSVTIPKALAAEAQKLADESDRDAQETLEELLEESIRMRRVPGIVFADGPTGRRARLSGTGLDIWEIILAYKAAGWDWEALKQAFDWLDERQLRMALTYYQTYPAEVDARIHSEEASDFEQFWAEHPWVQHS